MAKVFGGGGSSTPIKSSSTSTQGTQSNQSNSNVFSSGSRASCFDSGASRVLPTSREALLNTNQSFSSSPNVFTEGSSLNISGEEDYYNKSEIQKLLKTKADISFVYSEEEVDKLLASIRTEVNQSISLFISEFEVDEKISNSYSEFISYLAQNYYSNSQTYTKAQVDNLISQIDVGGDFLKKQPVSSIENTISPGINEAIPLTVKASISDKINVVQQWIDSESNSIGRIRNSGQVEFYGNLILGENIESWRPALEVNERRISGVADPIHSLDAVNKNYVEGYITEIIDNIVQGDDRNYVIDALEY